MRVELSVALALVAVAGCSEKHTPKPDPTKGPVGTLVRSDGGVTAIVTGVDPSGMHIDEDTDSHPATPPPGQNRPGRPIDVTLRSSPPGANVSVDGQSLGNTPAFWSGMADGHEHEFLFQLRGHAIARYRFVPVSSGVIHARLDPIAEEPDAGVPPPELVPPGTQQPTAPPTVIKPAPLAPVDAAPPVPPAPGSASGSATGSATGTPTAPGPGIGPQP
jgi:hypothetical protein